MICTSYALADWVTVNAAYQCNKENNTFSLHATTDSSNPDLPGTIAIARGFISLIDGEQVIECIINKTKIKTKIQRTAPSSSGFCGAMGYIHIFTFSINGNLILREPNEYKFNSSCTSKDNPMLFSIEVKANNKIPEAKLCRGVWTWENGYTNIHCEKEEIR